MHLTRVLFIALAAAISPLLAEDVTPIPPWSQLVSAFQKWGPEKNGMQLRAEADSECGMVSCWVRNALQKPLDYKPHALGYFLNVTALVRQGPVWVELQRKRTDTHFVYGTGYGMNDLVRAEPLKILESKHAYECVEERSYWRNVKIGESEGQTSEPRGDLPVVHSLYATFYIDLAEFEWPKNLLEQKTLEMTVTQSTDFGGKTFIVAPVFDLDTTAFKKFLAQLAKPAVPAK